MKCYYCDSPNANRYVKPKKIFQRFGLDLSKRVRSRAVCEECRASYHRSFQSYLEGVEPEKQEQTGTQCHYCGENDESIAVTAITDTIIDIGPYTLSQIIWKLETCESCRENKSELIKMHIREAIEVHGATDEY